jgi:ribosomal protein S6
MKTYELTYIISPNITIEEAEAKAKQIEVFVQENNGIIVKSEKPTAKTLSYRIKKMASGFFVFLDFQLEPEKLIELKNKIEKDTDVIRHIITTKNISKKIARVRGEKKKLTTDKKEEITIKHDDVEKEKPGIMEKIVGRIRKPKTEKVELNDIDKQLDEILGE